MLLRMSPAMLLPAAMCRASVIWGVSRGSGGGLGGGRPGIGRVGVGDAELGAAGGGFWGASSVFRRSWPCAVVWGVCLGASGRLGLCSVCFVWLQRGLLGVWGVGGGWRCWGWVSVVLSGGGLLWRLVLVEGGLGQVGPWHGV